MIIKCGTGVAVRFWKMDAVMMFIRKIKPAKIDSEISSKLKASSFLTDFHQSNLKAQQTIKIKQKQGDQKAKNQQQKSSKYKNLASKQKNSAQKQLQPRHSTKALKQSKQKSTQTQLATDENKIQLFQQQEKSPSFKRALQNLGKALDSIDPKQLRKFEKNVVAFQENKQIQTAIKEIKKLQLKDFSVLVHRLLVNSAKNNNTVEKYIWKQIQEDFLTRFEPTTNPVKIRSFSKVIYCLAKSKVHRDNSNTLVSTSISTNLQSFETKFALLLPSASHQSFTIIITSLSRMGPLSQQFSYITQRLYYSRYNQFNARQKVQINYALTRNSRKVDSKLITFIDSMNLKQILIMLRCYQNSNQLTRQILLIAEKNIILRKKQMNVIDIGDICSIYFEAMVKSEDPYKISPQLEKTLTEMYKILKSNINQVTFEKIWKDLPIVANRGFLQVDFVEQIMKTLKILRKKQIFPERIWKPLRQSFKKFQNLQLRTRLQQIK